MPCVEKTMDEYKIFIGVPLPSGDVMSTLFNDTHD